MEDLVNKIQELVDAPQWTEQDRLWLLQYLNTTDASELKALLLQKLTNSGESAGQVDPVLSQQMLRTIHEEIGITGSPSGAAGSPPGAAVVRLSARRIAAAALIGLILTGGLYLALRKVPVKELAGNKTPVQSSKHLTVQNDVLPGKDKAMLTLADGSTISLDDAQNGTLAHQGNTKVLKLDGRLSYEAAVSREAVSGAAANRQSLASGQIAYNTIVTPRGGQYQVVLPDGSQVWLNAASSLRFPTAFAGKERRVEVTGEAYFEIAKDLSMPFVVSLSTPGQLKDDPSGAGRTEVQVLGTHFNINAYNDEALLKTTLLEGSVKFVNGGKARILNPGQQSQLARNGQLNISDGVDLTEVMAWKNGIFHFEGSEIGTVMKQLSRWYDVEIVYGSQKINDLFYAEIPRNTKLSDALKALELTGKVDFKIEDKKIIVNQ